MSERGLTFEQNLVGWLAHSATGRREYAAFHTPGVLENAGADRYVGLLLEHGPGSAGARLLDMRHSGSIDPQDAETALRWAAGAPSVDDAYMLETARIYLRHRCHAIHAEQVALAADMWDDKLLSAADAELGARMSRLNRQESGRGANGFTAAGAAKAFSREKQEDLFTLPGYVGTFFRGRLHRGALVVGEAQPKVGKSAVGAREAVAAMRYGRRVLHISVGDMDQYETTARIISCECQRNGQKYEEGRRFKAVPCCGKALAGCDKECFGAAGFAPLNPPVAAEYLEETEVEAIIKAFPSFQPCTLCKGTDDYSPAVWWERADDEPIDEEEAVQLMEQIQSCGEYGVIETLFYPARQLTMRDLAGLLEERKRAKTPVDVLIVDYADLMGLDQQSKVPKWESLGYMWEAMRALAPEDAYNCLVLSFTQGNRMGGDLMTQTSTTTAGSRASIDNATMVYSLNQTPAERHHQLMRVSVVAARKGSFAPEHQAMCISRFDIQDPFYESWHKWIKTDKRENKS